jgi:hypothetical protein
MFLSKEELTIQVAQIDCIEVNYVDLTEASEDEVLQELAADPACADEKNARLRRECVSSKQDPGIVDTVLTSLTSRCAAPSDCLANFSRGMMRLW